MAFQLAILFAVYFLTYYESLFLKAVLPGPIKAISFGLMFLWGIISAVILRFILKKIGLSRYIDNNLQRRITGRMLLLPGPDILNDSSYDQQEVLRVYDWQNP